ncbi:MAG: chorismate synthase [Candidatus Melainabacteria bacterium]|nr:chorismate synthase [Candidatus Melainabacteria bacterium]
MLRLLTAGESHGPKLTALIDGMPAGLSVDTAFMEAELAARQGGYGRSGRQKIEKDKIDITGGVRHGLTTGAPVCFEIQNRDHGNWTTVMNSAPIDLTALDEAGKKQIQDKRIERFRPGHADLSGTIKYRLKDVRDVLERASARETAARVAAGSLAQLILRALGVKLTAHVVAIGPVSMNSLSREEQEKIAAMDLGELLLASRDSSVYCPHEGLSEQMEATILQALKDGDSLGGVVRVMADGLPPGLGSSAQWDRKLDGQLAQSLMSIQSAKAVEIGTGVENAALPGSRVHDAMHRDESGESPCYYVGRKTNRCGGLEGGMTNGERLILHVYFKPIPTMKKGLPSLSFPAFTDSFAHYERSDVCAIPAASVVAGAMVSLTLANAFLDKFAADTMVDLKESVETYRQYVRNLTKGKVDNAP